LGTSPACRQLLRSPSLPALLQRADIVALLDEWAARFFEELDYVREGENATRFAAQIKEDLPQVGRGGTHMSGVGCRVLPHNLQMKLAWLLLPCWQAP
jgi:hypothetical protein